MRKLLFAVIVVIIGSMSCKSDVEPIPDLNLSGKWNFVKAYRNAKETKTLDSGFFDFNTKDSLLRSNLFQVGDTKKFEIENNAIIVKEEELNLTIEKIVKDTMVLKGKIWKFDMELHLERTTPDSIAI